MIIHTHIPKTGGTTLNHVLRRAFQNHFVEIPVIQNRFKITADEMRQWIERYRTARVLAGHPLRYPCPEIPGIEYQYVGLVRDPIERVLSLYYYERRLFAADPHHRSKRPLAEYLVSVGKFGKSQCHWLHESGDVEDAKRILREYTLVGVTEQFDAALLLMRERLHLPFAALFGPRQNTSRSQAARAVLDARTLQNLRRELEPDIELHAFARELLAAALAQRGRRFFVPLRGLQLANRTLHNQEMLQKTFKGKARTSKRWLSSHYRAMRHGMP